VSSRTVTTQLDWQASEWQVFAKVGGQVALGSVYRLGSGSVGSWMALAVLPSGQQRLGKFPTRAQAMVAAEKALTEAAAAPEVCRVRRISDTDSIEDGAA
jgi:hypothetical protein